MTSLLFCVLSNLTALLAEELLHQIVLIILFLPRYDCNLILYRFCFKCMNHSVYDVTKHNMAPQHHQWSNSPLCPFKILLTVHTTGLIVVLWWTWSVEELQQSDCTAEDAAHTWNQPRQHLNAAAMWSAPSWHADETERWWCVLVRWLRTDIWGRAERERQILVLSHSEAAAAAAPPSPTPNHTAWLHPSSCPPSLQRHSLSLCTSHGERSVSASPRL